MAHVLSAHITEGGRVSDTAGGSWLQEEPQEERGAPGSRDQGLPPGEKPSGRPSGESDAEDYTAIDPQEPDEGPTLPAGDQGG